MTMTDCDAEESESVIKFECPCGICSLETYLQNGCPKSCIPYLGMTTLCKGDQENLNHILKTDTKKIMKSFTDLSNRTCDSLIRQGVIVERLIRVAINFNASLRDHLMELKSIDLVFAALTVEMSFFNHGILANIIEELGDENDKKRLSRYFQDFNEFCKRKVFEVEPGHCTCGQRLSQLKERKLFAVILPTGDKAMVETLGDVVNIKETLADILGPNVSPAALHLHRIDKGSMILVFSVPDCIAIEVFPLSKEKIAFLKVKGITLFIPWKMRHKSNQVEDVELSAGVHVGKLRPRKLSVGRAKVASASLGSDKISSMEDFNCNCFTCQHLLRNPQLVLCCHINFCLECINTIQAKGKPCPSCQQPHFEFIPNVKLQRLCQKMSFTCPYCNNFTSSFADEVQYNHWPKCPYFPVSCPNKCNIQPQRQNVDAHIEKECPFTLEDCDVKSETGCQERLPRLEMLAHIIIHVVPQSVQDALQRRWTWYTTFRENSGLTMPMPKGSGYEYEYEIAGREHFVPSALPLRSGDQLSASSSRGVKETSLHLLFSTGYVPPGYFTRLSVALSKERKCQISFSHGIYRNQFTILFGDKNAKLDEVTITEHISSVSVNISRSVCRKSHNLPFQFICRQVLNTILACSSDIRQWLPSIEISTAFPCKTCSPENSKEHFIEIPPKATTQSLLRCQMNKICTITPSEHYWLTISSSEEGFDLTGSLTRAELQVIGEEVQREGKLQALAESLEMTTHYKPSTQGINLLDRWQTEMKQFNVHARSHLVHHLRCINLDDIADRLKYNQLQSSQTAGSGLAEALFLPQDPLTEKDIIQSSRLMTGGDLEELASAFGISDYDLATIKSRFKKKEAQALQLMYKWHRETNGSKQKLCEILTATGFQLQGSDIPKIKDLLQRVKTTRWYRLGLELDIDNHTMQIIEADTKGEANMTESALRRVFQEWLKRKKNPSWSDIGRALKVMGEDISADKY